MIIAFHPNLIFYCIITNTKWLSTGTLFSLYCFRVPDFQPTLNRLLSESKIRLPALSSNCSLYRRNKQGSLGTPLSILTIVRQKLFPSNLPLIKEEWFAKIKSGRVPLNLLVITSYRLCCQEMDLVSPMLVTYGFMNIGVILSFFRKG